MAFAKVLALALVIAINWQEIFGHGMMMEPVSRSSAWRKGFHTPENVNDSKLFCGGFHVQYGKNGGKCGACGDDWSLPRPRPNENGGEYGTGVIVKTYRRGQVFTAKIHLLTNYIGFFDFNLCVLQGSKQVETDECFKQNTLWLPDVESHRYYVANEIKDFNIDVQLPISISCEHCVIRWSYHTGNASYGTCPDRRGGMGCGPQETFKNCADVSIL